MDKEQYELMYRIEDHHWWYTGMRKVTAALLARNRPLDTQCRLLDAGCGTGGTLAHWSGSAGFGVDFSPEALALCQRRGLRKVAQASVEALPFADASFDLVLSSDVLYHLGVSRDMGALQEFYRVLRPGGLAVVRLPAYDWLRGAHDVAVHTRRRYTGGELRRKLAEAGFQVEQVTHANTLLFPIALAKRLLEGRLTSSTSELEESSGWLTAMGKTALSVEAALVSRIDLPWGLSVIGVGRKREDRKQQYG